MPKVTELPDPVLLKIAEKARNEVLRRGLEAATSQLEVKKLVGEWREPAPAIEVPCHGRNASEQLDHARRISRIVNLLAVSYKWSDDFCLMIDVAESTARRLKFTITRPIEVKVSGPPLHLQAGDTLYVDGHGEAEVNTTPKMKIYFSDIEAIKNVRRMVGEWDPAEIKRQEFYDMCCKKHPFAMSTDMPAIVKMEQELASKVEFTPITCKLSDMVAERKRHLPNAMIVRGGHDAAGWK